MNHNPPRRLFRSISNICTEPNGTRVARFVNCARTVDRIQEVAYVLVAIVFGQDGNA
ncbi:hypothetical protein GGD62_008312 [Bradyrhizobium sp. ERR14]|nr:hypothetical protein [Bradyrhizobium sp. ERR14]